METGDAARGRRARVSRCSQCGDAPGRTTTGPSTWPSSPTSGTTPRRGDSSHMKRYLPPRFTAARLHCQEAEEAACVSTGRYTCSGHPYRGHHWALRKGETPHLLWHGERDVVVSLSQPDTEGCTAVSPHPSPPALSQSQTWTAEQWTGLEGRRLGDRVSGWEGGSAGGGQR